jgi:probable F420-dependent oxidoreductase
VTSDDPLRPGWGLSLPVFDSHRTGFAPVAEIARRAEALGFDSLWAGDHLFFHAPNLECLVALGVVAGATERIALGTGVLLPALREPIVLAKQLASLDVLSGGRLLTGLGVGGEYVPEWEAQGLDVRTRGARTDEAIAVLQQLVTGAPCSFHGRHFDVEAPALTPTPVAGRLPIWIGGRVDAAIRRAAEVGDGWFPGWVSAERIARERPRLAELAAAAGRPTPRIGLLLFITVGPLEEVLPEARSFTRQHYAMPWENMERYAVVGPHEHALERLDAYRRAGVEDFILAPLGADLGTQHERLAELGAAWRLEKSTAPGA